MSEIIDKSNILKVFGRNIKQIRSRKGLSQEKLAERINKSSHFVSLIERGETGISFSTIIDICTALDVDANSIFEDIIQPSNNKKAKPFKLNPDVNNFDEKDKEMVTYLINYIVDSKK
ncbi:MAG: helix-turn-helix transcriptional regulator [Clostridia bacterium]|nr:helix-turn-helix transcriptional regulator [Clostridia bacterium]